MIFCYGTLSWLRPRIRGFIESEGSYGASLESQEQKDLWRPNSQLCTIPGAEDTHFDQESANYDPPTRILAFFMFL